MSSAVIVILEVASPSRAATLGRATTNYLTHCGGCHGIEGVSGASFVPQLRETVGVFTCSEEGRRYLVRVPGVSMSLIRDDQELADVLNFVVFRMGGASTPPGTKPYSASEIHDLRADPIVTTDILKARAMVLQRSLALCSVSGK
ncbi:c-type cytochrome [Acetobacter oeni]|nr:cytochrome c [Acetobacter oeni]MBB3882296.1 mono/diheme cytochrome c family protein [Acetobacter oeni]